MLVSVVVCTHSLDNYRNLVEAVDSLLQQTYPKMEIIVVVDGNGELHERVLAGYGSKETVKAVLLEENVGISGARNAGVRAAKGDVIAFLDDDGIAEKGWMENLVATYRGF